MGMHTPGPWRVAPDGGRIISDDRTIGRINTTMETDSGAVRDMEGEANACLVVAAPELYEALVNIMGPCVREEHLAQARAAIAKAGVKA